MGCVLFFHEQLRGLSPRPSPTLTTHRSASSAPSQLPVTSRCSPPLPREALLPSCISPEPGEEPCYPAAQWQGSGY